MTDLDSMKPPTDLDWPSWVDRWDRMQERYLVKRAERFEVIVRMVRCTQRTVERVVDLGCGTGSLMLGFLEAFPKAEIMGVDFDPTLLWLARARLERFGERSQLRLLDLRNPAWIEATPGPADAVVSATALHWLPPVQLAETYRAVAQILHPGGIFLNADHVGSDSPEIHRQWEAHREEMRKQEHKPQSDDWEQFWAAYSEALQRDVAQIHQRVLGGWEGGVEEGLPMPWHFDRMRESGFLHVDCFWRCDCDAIYGGVRQ